MGTVPLKGDIILVGQFRLESRDIHDQLANSFLAAPPNQQQQQGIHFVEQLTRHSHLTNSSLPSASPAAAAIPSSPATRRLQLPSTNPDLSTASPTRLSASKRPHSSAGRARASSSENGANARWCASPGPVRRCRTPVYVCRRRGHVQRGELPH